ncbi:MAG TPA: hypothetical protein VGT61_12540 [Thermomicrobiales bacterium]|nr:hypothetical protein [Thermomicrobiales bacterium]
MTQPAPQSDSHTTQPATIPLGATVYGQDNARFGQVAGSYRDYLIVERGFFMPVDYYVPLRAVRRVEGAVVTLGITRDAALTQGWEKAPFTAETGPRRSRRPAVSSETPAARTATDRPEERPRSAWPAATPGAGAARPTENSTTGEDARTISTGPTVSGNAPLFSDSYAIGVNTDSYQALQHHRSSPAGPDVDHADDAAPAEPSVSMDASADAATPSAGPVVPAQGTVAPLANAATRPEDGSDGDPDTQSDAPDPGASTARRAAGG